MAAETANPVYFTNTYDVKINVPARYLGADLTDNLTTLLTQRYENRCYKETYLRRNSIRLLRRTVGQTVGSHFNGDMTYFVTFEAQAYKPVTGSYLKVQVVGRNAVGVQCRLYPPEIPMEIFLSKNQNASRLTLLNQLAIDQIVVVKILNYLFRNDQIYALGLLEETVSDTAVPLRYGLRPDAIPLALDHYTNRPVFGRDPEAASEIIAMRLTRLQQLRKNTAVLPEYLQGLDRAALIYPSLTTTPLTNPPWPTWPTPRSIFTITPQPLSRRYLTMAEILGQFPGQLFSALQAGQQWLVVEDRPSPGDRGDPNTTVASHGGTLQALVETRLYQAPDLGDQISAIAVDPLFTGPAPGEGAYDSFKQQQQQQQQQQQRYPAFAYHMANALQWPEAISSQALYDLIVFDQTLPTTDTPLPQSLRLRLTELFQALGHGRKGSSLIWRLGRFGDGFLGSLFSIEAIMIISHLYNATELLVSQVEGADASLWLVARQRRVANENVVTSPLDNDDPAAWQQQFTAIVQSDEIREAFRETHLHRFFTVDLELDGPLRAQVTEALEAHLDKTLEYWDQVVTTSTGSRPFDPAYARSQQQITALEWAQRFFPPLQTAQGQTVSRYDPTPLNATS